MKSSLVDALCCSKCAGTNFALDTSEIDGEEILSGSVRCACGAVWPIVRGILRTVKSDDYTGSFSFEWQLHRRTQLDDENNDKSSRVFREKTGLALTDLAGKDILDVGVGTGRFADVVQRCGGRVTCIDLSYAVETAIENVGRRANVNVVQADAFALPFRKNQFDLIYSIGVLHHTPDCKKAFLGLLPYLRPGGTIVIWVYDAHCWVPGSMLDSTNQMWRSITTRLPSWILYALCICELPLYFLRKLPGVDQFMHLVLPGVVYHAIPKTNQHPRIKEHILDTFDWYSPRFQSKHTYPEVFSWFEEAGLEAIRIMPTPVAVSGRKTTTDTQKNISFGKNKECDLFGT
jgi:SAM-dependent methyltransferase